MVGNRLLAWTGNLPSPGMPLSTLERIRFDSRVQVGVNLSMLVKLREGAPVQSAPPIVMVAIVDGAPSAEERAETRAKRREIRDQHRAAAARR